MPKTSTPILLLLSFHVIKARRGHTSAVLSDGSVLLMGGYYGTVSIRTMMEGHMDMTNKNDVWKTVDGGASWILVTSSAGWEGKKILHLSNSLPIFPSLGEKARCPTATVCVVCRLQT